MKIQVVLFSIPSLQPVDEGDQNRPPKRTKMATSHEPIPKRIPLNATCDHNIHSTLVGTLAPRFRRWFNNLDDEAVIAADLFYLPEGTER